MIFKASLADARIVTELALELWPDNDPYELCADFEQLLSQDDCAVFLCYENGNPSGFAQCQLRHDYVEGTDSSPVGYLEGIYVRENLRGHGLARAMLRECEAWARDKGCTEFASDCELNNETSLLFHLRMGFIEANRIICFTKTL